MAAPFRELAQAVIFLSIREDPEIISFFRNPKVELPFPKLRRNQVHKNANSRSLIKGTGIGLAIMAENSTILGSESVKKRDEDSDDGSTYEN